MDPSTAATDGTRTGSSPSLAKRTGKILAVRVQMLDETITLFQIQVGDFLFLKDNLVFTRFHTITNGSSVALIVSTSSLSRQHLQCLAVEILVGENGLLWLVFPP